MSNTHSKIIIRNETPNDYGVTYNVNNLAFGKEDEAKLVNQLRTDADVVISLVAEIDGKVVGHVLMSKMYIATQNGDIPALALAPVAVNPDVQNQGIGSALIKEAIKIAPEKGETIILVLGHKEYYPKFGFSAELAKNIESPFDKDHFMALELKQGALDGVVGKVKYSVAFGLGPEWTKQYMQSKEVTELYQELEKIGVKIWIDGGWAVDALLGKQMRPHKDLDIAVQWKETQKLKEFFTTKGYKQIREDNKWNFVLGDSSGRETDVHAFIYDDKGNIVEGIMYPAESLTGIGTLDGEKVRCISAEYMVKFLAPWVDKHPFKYQNAISELCKKFGIELPEEYKNLNK